MSSFLVAYLRKVISRWNLNGFFINQNNMADCKVVTNEKRYVLYTLS